MKREIVAPTEIIRDRAGGGDETIRTHPAFATIGAYRCSGGPGTMFGSHITKHHGMVRIEISHAEEHKDNFVSHYFARKPILTLNMTEIQWSTFVSAMNVGSGVPCTLERGKVNGEYETIPEILDEDTFKEKRAKDIAGVVEERNRAIAETMVELDALIASPTVSKVKLRDIRKTLSRLVEGAANTFQFAADMVTEHTEKLINEGKAELDAHLLVRAAQAAGLGLQQDQFLQLEHKDEE